ncbi:MAG: DUF1553 domain-containing protein [Acidobacteria bacterium]|nr:DUF1553 domain-containing protein [Acidobacteriota bacterium]
MRQWCWYFIVTVAAAQPVEERARRILDANCASCHGAAKMGGLDLRTRESALAKGSIVPGKAAESRLIAAVERQGTLRMPPGKNGLERADVATLRNWIDAGAKWTAASNAEPNWWSFKKLKRPPGASIDEFVDGKLREKGLAPNGMADRRTLIRRAYLDLHGLPPAPAEIAAFVEDASPDAWPKLIDKLLASPRYGERWGRHWLDVVRYADTGGFETDIYFPNAWRYRDYVIKAFNEDKPFERFVREQIAGDELYPDDLDLDGGFKVAPSKLANLDARIATGLYTIGPVYHEAALFGGQVRYEWLTDAADTTGEAFLGLTFGCARCHNHKFDPITQRDYHSMMAIFAGSEEREIPVIPQFNIFGFKSGYPNWLRVEELKTAIQKIDSAARQRVVNKVRALFPAAVLEAHAVAVEKRTPAQRELAARLEKAFTEAGLEENAQGKDADIPLTPEESKRRNELIVELGKAALKANPVMQTATVLGHAATVPSIHITHRGDWRSKGEQVPPAFPAALQAKPIDEIANAKLARRAALANWLTEPDHPLAARVYVNRIWHWHFGRGIVATPNDFGRQGEEPTHPELLDWLASDFLANGGSTKRLHKVILLSAAYRRASTHSAANARVDAGNLFLWRANRLRMDAETLRDSVLTASGALNTKMGGRPVVPVLGREEYITMWARNQWPEAMDPAEHDRRSVYLYVKRSFPLPMLTTFDAPDTSVSCARREATTVAPQALTLMNGDFMVRQSGRFAERLRAEEPGNPRAQIVRAWQIALGRAPREPEIEKALAAPSLEKLCLVLLNMNEFLYVD